jgi:membrane protease YdiL (CAAX protease family)
MKQKTASLAPSEPREALSASPIVSWLRRHQLLVFFALTFAFTWGLWFLFIASRANILPLKLASSSPVATFLIQFAGWGPAISALVLTALIGGKRGIGELFSRLLRWRVGLQWYALVIFLPLVIVWAAVGLYILFVGSFPGLTAWYIPLIRFVPLLPVAVVLVGLAEEPGWRGYALPRLLSRYAPFTAGVLLGIIWGLWHLPLYTFIYPYGVLGFLVFLLRVVALSILFTWVYLHTKKSVLITILFHAATDTSTALFFPSVVAVSGFSGFHFMLVSVLFTGLLWVMVGIVLAISALSLSRRSI